jgi:hypothetical protein
MNCKHCGHSIVKYSYGGSWDIIGEDDPWVHVSDDVENFYKDHKAIPHTVSIGDN